MKFTITSATNTNQKNRKIIKEFKIAIGKSKAVVPFIVLEGLYFDIQLGMNWLKATWAIIDVANGTIRVAKEKISYKAWLEPALFALKEATKTYCKELCVIPKGEQKLIEVYHGVLEKNKVVFLRYSKRGKSR